MLLCVCSCILLYFIVISYCVNMQQLIHSMVVEIHKMPSFYILKIIQR